MKSDSAKSAVTKHQEAVAAAKKQYDDQLAAAKAALIADLDKALE